MALQSYFNQLRPSLVDTVIEDWTAKRDKIIALETSKTGLHTRTRELKEGYNLRIKSNFWLYGNRINREEVYLNGDNYVSSHRNRRGNDVFHLGGTDNRLVLAAKGHQTVLPYEQTDDGLIVNEGSHFIRSSYRYGISGMDLYHGGKGEGNEIFSGEGADLIISWGKNDQIYGDAGGDTVIFREGAWGHAELDDGFADCRDSNTVIVEGGRRDGIITFTLKPEDKMIFTSGREPNEGYSWDFDNINSYWTRMNIYTEGSQIAKVNVFKPDQRLQLDWTGGHPGEDLIFTYSGGFDYSINI